MSEIGVAVRMPGREQAEGLKKRTIKTLPERRQAISACKSESIPAKSRPAEAGSELRGAV
jgi:hypothetical protein